jgi:hypothetical protein
LSNAFLHNNNNKHTFVALFFEPFGLPANLLTLEVSAAWSSFSFLKQKECDILTLKRVIIKSKVTIKTIADNHV